MAILVRQVTLRNYKSIAKAAVDLGDLTILVGPNGAGKSNFVDALRFVADSLNITLEVAMRQRGGIAAVRRHSGGHPNHFAIGLRLSLEKGRNAHYGFQIGARPSGGFVVQQERAVVSDAALAEHHFEVKEGELVAASGALGTVPPKASADRLYLTTVSGVPAFRPLYDALANIGSYNINPATIREVHPHDPGEILARDGANLAGVVKRLKRQDHDSFTRIQEYLRQIVPDVEGVEHQEWGPNETLIFRQRMQRQKDLGRFYAVSMSDGTLRSLGVLVALFQARAGTDGAPPLIVIEEPEATIHPGAVATITDALVEAARERQVVATTHSPDLLDHPALASAAIYSVEKAGGESFIAPIDNASLSAIKEGLYTPGELLRSGQLQHSPTTRRRSISQNDLFGALSSS
jgi:predicted ATPase